MKQTMTHLAIAAAVAAGIGGYLACDADDGVVEVDRTGELTVEIHPDPTWSLRDNPSTKPTAILVKFSSAWVHHVSDGWVDLQLRGAVDLMDPQAGVQRLLGATRLPDGMYDELRFEVQTAAVQIDRQWYPLEIPSGDESGLKIHSDFCMVEGRPAVLQLEWSVDEKLHHNDARGWWLTPSITVFSPPTCTDDLRTPPVNRPPTRRAAG